MSACAPVGLMHLRDPYSLEWLEVDNEQKAISFYMPSSNIYEGAMNMTIDYAEQNDGVLQIEVVQTYHVPQVDPGQIYLETKWDGTVTEQPGYYTAEFHSLL